MSALGQKQTCALQRLMSALPPIATAKADFGKPSCPLYPRNRTCALQLGMSAKGQQRTSALQEMTFSLCVSHCALKSGVAHLHPISHSGGDGAIARFFRCKQHLDSEHCHIARILKNRGNDRWLAGHWATDIARIIVFFMHQPNWRAYLQKLAEKPKLFAVFITAPTPAIGATDTQIYFADRHAPAGWAQHPALHQLGFGVRVPDQFPRRAETAHDAHFAIAR